jgi:hypothetical protein
MEIPNSGSDNATYMYHAELQKQQLAAIGTILRGHEESLTARLSLLIVLELVIRGLLRKSETVLENIPDWDGSLPTPQQLITMLSFSLSH